MWEKRIEKVKECIARIKQAGRPLTLQFVESAHSLLLPRAAGSDSDDSGAEDSDEEPAPQPAPARARTQLEKQRDYARAEQARPTPLLSDFAAASACLPPLCLTCGNSARLLPAVLCCGIPSGNEWSCGVWVCCACSLHRSGSGGTGPGAGEAAHEDPG